MKTRLDFVSNSSSCSFFVWLETNEDIEEFKKLIDMLKEKNVSMTLFSNLADANDRWYGEVFNGNKFEVDGLNPGNFMLIDVCDDHWYGYEDKFYDVKDRFTDKYKFKLYSDKEAHMSAGDKLPKAKEY